MTEDPESGSESKVCGMKESQGGWRMGTGQREGVWAEAGGESGLVNNGNRRARLGQERSGVGENGEEEARSLGTARAFVPTTFAWSFVS